ncbi:MULTISPECIES: hypothetical protein [Cecembia]|uniref:Uncharacterized protein n=2 Tax=Cecembia TaxID=1187078 RepID=A0A4Q7P5U6_9BACT|nr:MULTISPECIES: hypothetical protein [Cecembia]PSL03021.1 hypothetical protein CLV48_108131 [Cecembia rubra]RZS95344.1 hypothetical protein BC751_0866 [Cecembia calidifontis]
MKRTEKLLFELKPSEFRKMVLKSLHSGTITKDEAKVLIRDGQKDKGIFLFEDDLTDADLLLKSGLEKMGYFGGIILDGTGKDFLEVKQS